MAVTKISTDALPRIDAFLLHRKGALTDGVVTRWQWPMLPPLPTITVTARAEGCRVFFSVDGRPEVACSVVYKPGNAGSSYPFLQCACERPTPYPTARYLYIRDGQVACRDCHKLEYPCRIMPRNFNSAQRRLNQARARVATIETEVLRLRREQELKSLRTAP